MNILMTSVFFYPHIGGIETVTEYLADEFTRMGHHVTVVTRTSEAGEKTFPYKVLRQPSKRELWKVFKDCEVFVHQGISLNWVWPLFLKRKPWFVVYHQVYYQPGILGKLKKLCSSFSHNIAVSNTTAKGSGLKDVTVIYNSFNSQYYHNGKNINRDGIVYVGKVTKAKGVDVLIEGFNLFKKKTSNSMKLTIVGGSNIQHESDIFKNQASNSEYAKDIIFTGFKQPMEINEILNRNKIQVVPSVAAEAFGVVVLEGLSCGCRMVGSDGDGIAEAMHGCGHLFKKGDSKDLCEKLILSDLQTDEEYNIVQKKTEQWLDHLCLRKVAERYIQEFDKQVSSCD